MLVRAPLARTKFPYFSAYVGTRSLSAFQVSVFLAYVGTRSLSAYQVPVFFSLCWYALSYLLPSFHVFQLMLVPSPFARTRFPCFSAYVGTRSLSAYQVPVFFSLCWYALP